VRYSVCVVRREQNGLGDNRLARTFASRHQSLSITRLSLSPESNSKNGIERIENHKSEVSERHTNQHQFQALSIRIKEFCDGFSFAYHIRRLFIYVYIFIYIVWYTFNIVSIYTGWWTKQKGREAAWGRVLMGLSRFCWYAKVTPSRYDQYLAQDLFGRFIILMVSSSIFWFIIVLLSGSKKRKQNSCIRWNRNGNGNVYGNGRGNWGNQCWSPFPCVCVWVFKYVACPYKIEIKNQCW